MWHNTFQSFPIRTRYVNWKNRPFLYFFEPLDTQVPPPPDSRPYCCYVRTVIFYKHPTALNADRTLQEWDRVESRWDLLGQRWTDDDIGWSALAPLVFHDEMIYEITTGEVFFVTPDYVQATSHNNFLYLPELTTTGWHKRWAARRVRHDDHRWPWILARSLAEFPPERLSCPQPQ